VFGKEELKKGGELYNDARIIVEANNHGLTTLVALRNTGYNGIYYHQSLDSRGRRMPKIGFPTNPQTKPLIINGIGAFLESLFDHFRANNSWPSWSPIDSQTVIELMTYGINDSGGTEAQSGCHDDLVISYGLALYLIRFAGVSRFFPHARAA